MKKYLATFFCLLGMFWIPAYPQVMRLSSIGSDGSSIVKKPNNNETYSKSALIGEPKKVLMHYMGWFGAGSSGRHWADHQPRTSVIGYYDSRSWATQIYHILLSWSCGIDGLIINVKDDFDYQSLKMLVPTLKRISDIGNTAFKYEFAISYDDQGMTNIETAKTKFIRDSSLMKKQDYLKYEGIPVIFIYNYKDPAPYLSPEDYSTALEAVFLTNKPKVIWNEIEAAGLANSYYPWVQGWAGDGSDWGKVYLDWFYKTIATTPGLDFATGGVWAGFDDRLCTWGKNRWIDRKNGDVYNSTWSYPINYLGTLPLKWVYIETWNDWNEGSEIEPSSEFSYQYLISTINKVNTFKGAGFSSDNSKFEAAKKIYEAADLIERDIRDSSSCYSTLTSSINHFILNDFNLAINEAGYIINSNCATSVTELDMIGIEIYPNPANFKLYIKVDNGSIYSVQILNLQGSILLNRQACTGLETIDLLNFPNGTYLVRLLQNNKTYIKKIVVK